MMRDVRGDFPVLSKESGLAYLDSACTSLKPAAVIDAEASYYKEAGACGGRSSHMLGRRTTELTEDARRKVASFVGAPADSLVWTKNTTEALNIVASGLDYSKKRKVVTTVLEHHAVLLPFMRLREAGRIELEILGCGPDGKVDYNQWAGAVDRGTALVVTNNGNNTLGTSQCSRELVKLAHDAGALVCVDGAQGVPHRRVDMRAEGYDFLCFSAHKMLGPTGIGALAMRGGIMKTIEPLVLGGGTVKAVTLQKAVAADDFTRFEAGVQHYSGIIGFAAACGYLRALGMESVEAHERSLGAAMHRALESAGAEPYGTGNGARSALVSFNLKGAKAHDVALMLDKDGIAVRSGFFCAQPAMEALGAKNGAVRASAYVYNNEADVRRLGESLQRIAKLY